MGISQEIPARVETEREIVMLQFAARKKRTQKIVQKLKELFPKARIVLKYSNNWELLVAVILSAQCTDKIEQDLMKLLPKKDWFFFTYGLIEYGRYICPARKHDCAEHPSLA